MGSYVQTPVIVRYEELPLPVVVEGRNGEREVYEIRPAGRKFGASLQKVDGLSKELIVRELKK